MANRKRKGFESLKFAKKSSEVSKKKRRFFSPRNPIELRFRSLLSSSLSKTRDRDSRVNDQDDEKVPVDDDSIRQNSTIQVFDARFLPLDEEDKAPVEHANGRFLPLDEDEKAQVEHAFSKINRMKVLVSHLKSNINIMGGTLQCLMPTKWLDDKIIDLYLELLKERDARDPIKYPKCHFFNSFFYTKLVGKYDFNYNYDAVRRWTTKKKLGYDLIDCHMIFVPIHTKIHWALAVINTKERKFMYFDSLSEADPAFFLNPLAKYLVDEVKDKSGKVIDVCSWDSGSVENIPKQRNGDDCGMFMLKYIDFLSRGLSLDFCQNDMPYFRLRTAKEILRLRVD